MLCKIYSFISWRNNDFPLCVGHCSKKQEYISKEKHSVIQDPVTYVHWVEYIHMKCKIPFVMKFIIYGDTGNKLVNFFYGKIFL